MSADKTCGCGNTCSDKGFAPCPNSYNGINSAGCSPLALDAKKYEDDDDAKSQVTCVDASNSKTAGGCKFTWNDDLYEKYPKGLKSVCTV